MRADSGACSSSCCHCGKSSVDIATRRNLRTTSGRTLLMVNNNSDVDHARSSQLSGRKQETSKMPIRRLSSVDPSLLLSPSSSLLLARRYSAGVSCRRVSVRPSVTSRCSTETTKRRITQTTPHDSAGTLVFCCRRSRQNSNGITPNGGAKCRRSRLDAAATAANWRLSTWSVVNLVRSQV